MYLKSNNEFEMTFEARLTNRKTLITCFKNTIPYFDDHPEVLWDIGFAVRDNAGNTIDGITNDHNAFEIMGKIKKAVDIFTAAKKPKYVSFLCKEERFNIYKNKIKRLFGGWTEFHYNTDDNLKGLMLSKNGDIPFVVEENAVHYCLGGIGPMVTMVDGVVTSAYRIDETAAQNILDVYLVNT